MIVPPFARAFGFFTGIWRSAEDTKRIEFLELLAKEHVAFLEHSHLLDYLDELLGHAEELVSAGIDKKHVGWDESKRAMHFDSLEIVLRKITDRRGTYDVKTYFSATITI